MRVVALPVRLASTPPLTAATPTMSSAAPGEVVDGQGVGSTEGPDVDRLDIVEVHRDGGDVAGGDHPAAVGAGLEDLADVAAVEDERVAPGPALDDVGGVARIPLDHVVAGSASMRSAPWLPSMTSSSVPATSTSGPLLPRSVSAGRDRCIALTRLVDRG